MRPILRWLLIFSAVSLTRHPISYADIIAYDWTRIVRPREEGSPLDGSSSGYVNASLVREPDLVLDESTLPRQWWVAAQVRHFESAGHNMRWQKAYVPN